MPLSLAKEAALGASAKNATANPYCAASRHGRQFPPVERQRAQLFVSTDNRVIRPAAALAAVVILGMASSPLGVTPYNPLRRFRRGIGPPTTLSTMAIFSAAILGDEESDRTFSLRRDRQGSWVSKNATEEKKATPR